MKKRWDVVWIVMCKGVWNKPFPSNNEEFLRPFRTRREAREVLKTWQKGDKKLNFLYYFVRKYVKA